MKLMRGRVQRNNLMAPLRYFNVAVTPHRNPSCKDANDEEEDVELQVEVKEEKKKKKKKKKSKKNKKKKNKKKNKEEEEEEEDEDEDEDEEEVVVDKAKKRSGKSHYVEVDSKYEEVEVKEEKKEVEVDKAKKRRGKSRYVVDDCEYEEVELKEEKKEEGEVVEEEDDDWKKEREKKKSGRCYHVIEMFNSLDPSVRVQLLVCDYDGYIVGFRRQENGVWGTWYRLRGECMPTWLNPVEIGVSGNHGKETTMGGVDCIKHMFYGLAPSEHSLAEIKAALLRAMVMFCEALRFLCILQMVIDAIANNQDATPLPNHIWSRINNWGQLSKMALQVCKNGAVDSPTLLRRLMHRCRYFLFEEIIGDRTKGDLTLLMRNDEILLDRALRESLQEEGAGEDVIDPRF